jgi:hypothetical protein
MPSTYSPLLKIELIATGEQSGLWGATTDTNLGTAIEEAITAIGAAVFTTDADLTLTLSNSNAAQVARCLVLNMTSSGSLTATRNLVVPNGAKQYIVWNNTTGGQSIVVKTSAGTGITVTAGAKAHLFADGTNVVYAFNYVTPNGVETLTNKRITPRVNITTTTTSPWAWNSDSYDQQGFTALANALTINADAGTPTDGQKTVFRFYSSAIRVLTFTGGVTKGFRPIGVALTISGSNFTYSTTANKTTYFGCIYNSADTRWDIVALSQEI